MRLVAAAQASGSRAQALADRAAARREDIRQLAPHFVEVFARRMGNLVDQLVEASNSRYSQFFNRSAEGSRRVR